MSDSVISLKSINALLTHSNGGPMTYWIPAYQRGYRWSPLQVTQLLDDIWDFVQNSEGGTREQFYCLQPLVVKARSDGAFEVVDGQQRLTTIFIILTYLKDMVSMLGKTRFKLTFETRGQQNESFLQDIDLSRADECPDFNYICRAYRAVEGWFKARDRMHWLKLLQHLVNDDEAGRNVKVIWFQLADLDNPVDAFTRLNVGKIALTNAELIRALFLRRNGNETEVTTRQLIIASEWDSIEKALQHDPFWGFLSNIPGYHMNRIEFLFDLHAKSQGMLDGLSDATYGIFYAYARRLKEKNATPASEWLAVKQLFMLLEEWYEDRHLYHIVGFLINWGTGIDAIRRLSDQCTKSTFHRRLRAEIFSRLIGGTLPSGVDELSEKLDDFLDGLTYGSPRVKPTLLLFNIATLLQNPRSNLRFQFDSFKATLWDIEHIRSVASKAPESHPDREAWLQDCLRYFEVQGIESALQAEIKAFLDLQPKDAAALFEPLYEKTLAAFHEEPEENADDTIANLTLLDSKTNRSYQNAVFAVKRWRLLQRDQSGIFVPLCTRNVFLKCYNPRVDNLMFWSKGDREAYRSAIFTTLLNFFQATLTHD